MYEAISAAGVVAGLLLVPTLVYSQQAAKPPVTCMEEVLLAENLKPGARIRSFAAREAYPPPLKGNAGYWLENDVGVYTTNDVQTNLALPRHSTVTITLYAPTSMPARTACVEMVSIHLRRPTDLNSTVHEYGFWNWCHNSDPIGFKHIEPMDADWKLRYVRIQEGEERSFSIVMKSGATDLQGRPCWWGLLYNFQMGGWETRVDLCGNSSARGSESYKGFTQWESFEFDRLGSCPFLPGIRASWIQTMGTDNVWRNMRYYTTLAGTGPCWNRNPSPGYYSMRTDGLSPYSWNAYTPNGQ